MPEGQRCNNDDDGNDVNVIVTVTTDSDSTSSATVGDVTSTSGAVGDGDTGNGGEDKVTICHNGQTLEVAESAVPGHLDHGDTLGPCPETVTETE